MSRQTRNIVPMPKNDTNLKMEQPMYSNDIQQLYRWLSTTIILPLLAIMSGCAAQVNMLPTLSPQTVLAPQDGVIVVRVINASSYPLPFNQLTIAPENLNADEKILPSRLSAIDNDIEGSTIFAAPAKAGNYSLSDIRALHFRGDFIYSRFVDSDISLGTFTVKPGEITDLGSLVFYQQPDEDRFLELLARVPESANGSDLSEYFSFFKYDESTLKSWKDDGRKDERESLFFSIVQNPVVFQDTYVAPDNSLYFLGKLGVILIRTPEGEWEMDAVDTNYQLNTISKSESGDLLVGGEEGLMFLKPVGGQWLNISTGSDSKIMHLEFINDNQVDALISNGSTLFVQRGVKEGENFNWQTLNQYGSGKGWAYRNIPVVESKSRNPNRNKDDATEKFETFDRIGTVDISKHFGRHTLYLRTLNSYENRAFTNGDLTTVTYNPDNWEITGESDDNKMTAIFKSGAAYIGIEEAGFWSWTGLPSIYSATEDGQWTEMKTEFLICPDGTIVAKRGCKGKAADGKPNKSKTIEFRFSSLPLFSSPKEALAIVRINNIDDWPGEDKDEVKLFKTRDGGVSWADTGNKPPKKYCTDLITEITDRLLVGCNGATGDFYESTDGGANWNHVRQQVNF